MAKEDTLQLLKVVSTIIQGLTHDHYTKLLNGEATLQYVEGDPNRRHSTNLAFSQLDDQLKNLNDSVPALNVLNERKKVVLQAFCEFLKIEISNQETKGEICKKLLVHYKIGDGETGESSGFSQISAILEKQESREQALTFLKNEPSVRTKAQLNELAKYLEVYVPSKYKKNEVVEKIVDSVVGAQIRGNVIRNKRD